PIQGIAFTPDGKGVVTAHPVPRLLVWDAVSGLKVRTVLGQSKKADDLESLWRKGQFTAGGLSDLQPVAGGKALLHADARIGVRLINPAYEITRDLNFPSADVAGWTGLSMSANLRRLASAGPRGLELWDTASRNPKLIRRCATLP